MIMRMRKFLFFTVLFILLVASSIVQSAIIGADGGITLYISYNNPDVAGGASWNDNITQTNGPRAGGANCSPTNGARSSLGAPNSPGSCTSGDTCLGRVKLIGDIDQLAEYIYQSTQGAHYLRRVYLSNNGRAWSNADIKWSIGTGGSTSSSNGWISPGAALTMRSSFRRCIHDVVHHELGHYFYNLPDRYATSPLIPNYYQGRIGGGSAFTVTVTERDPNTVMANNFPHLFVDTTNAEITVDYTPPGESPIVGEVLTPDLLSDADPNNDGPNRAHHGHTHPFAQDEWSLLPSRHADLTGVHTEGDFSDPDFALMPEVDIRFLGEETPHPGSVLLLDRSGSMGVTTNGITAAQYVQEAGMYLYHSSLSGDYVGTNLYNSAVEELFDYDEYDPANQLPLASFRVASGSTNIATALESAIDTLIAEHGDDGAQGGKIVLMSDGKQTTGSSLWDQVDRAVDKGIQINTMSFGNADLPTMNAIATSTDGDPIEMSESTDGSELKLGMARELSELRGLTPIHFQKGFIKPNTTAGNVLGYEGTFEIPPNNRALQFYVFLTQSNAAMLDVELEDSKGNIYKANPQNVAKLGRLNGITVAKPIKGKWKFRIKASKRSKGQFPVNDPMEIIGYVDNGDLDATMSVAPTDKPFIGQYRISAQVNHRYPLTNVVAVADIYRGHNKIASIPLRDDGKEHIDELELDGIYSGIFYPQKFSISEKRPKVRIDVRFTTTTKSHPATNAHYETGVDLKALSKDYQAKAKHIFTAFATDTVSFNKKDNYKPKIVDLKIDRRQVKPGDKGKIAIRIANAYISKSNLRVSLGQGVYTHLENIERDDKKFVTTLELSYHVEEDATKGSRDILLQANQVRLEKSDVLAVRR